MLTVREVVLRPIDQPAVGLEAESICPDTFAGKAGDHLSELPIWRGNRKVALGDHFEVEGRAGSIAGRTRIVIEGDVARTKRIGQGMTGGELVVRGTAGKHTGSGMSGGRLEVEGDCGDWAGMAMTGGELVVQGSAGHHLGAAPPGDWTGMTGGRIEVVGDCGVEAGAWMAGGTLIVRGTAGSFLGVHMQKGEILACACPRRVGGEMRGGLIVVLAPVHVLPSFVPDGTVDDVDIAGERLSGPFARYSGDVAEKGKGTLLVREG